MKRLARNDSEVYSTYYNPVEAEMRLPAAAPWDSLRRIAEEAIVAMIEHETEAQEPKKR